MPRSSKIFRLFISSTFMDLKRERTALQLNVFPRLEELCAQYGAKFQAIDLRWGVSTEAQLDHKTLDICINELRRCKEMSPKPNFLILLGNRYGWRPVPTMVEKNEFEQIRQYIRKTNITQFELLNNWYREDKNQVPSTYRLLPRVGIYEDPELWTPVESELRSIFDEIVEVLPLTPAQKNKYTLSATEYEIQEGAFAQEDARDHVFAFFREFQQLPPVQEANEYLDCLPDGNLDLANQSRLAKLKKNIEEFLPKDNICRQTIEWQEGNIDNSYLDQFWKEILSKLEIVIKEECQDITEFTFVEKEQEIHGNFSKNLSQHFVGREKEFVELEKRIESGSSYTVICGESGVGKTAFAAELSNHLTRLHPKLHSIQRFIGASSFGMNTIELLQSIVAEVNPNRIDDILRKRELDEVFSEMITTFQEVPSDKRYVIIIDAIDQLQDRHFLSIFSMQEIPENFSVIITVAKDSTMFTSLTEMIEDNQFITIEEMSQIEANELLDQWLYRENRMLQPLQKTVVLKAFSQCPLPLYLKLAFEEVKLWTSYNDLCILHPSIEGIIQQFFERLSHPSHHGSLLIKNVLGLLAASRNGLEEAELLDLLSKNSQLMEDFHIKAKHEHTDHKLPIVIWARLFNDIEPYLTERNENGLYLYSFYHRQVEKKIKDTYLQQSFHTDIVEHFETMPNFTDGDTKKIPNSRKASELPFQLYKSGAINQLERLLTDFHFLQCKLQAKISHDLLKDYENLRSLQIDLNNSTVYVDDFERFCRICHALLTQYPEQILSFAIRMEDSSKVFYEAKRYYKRENIPYISGESGLTSEDRCLHIFQLQDKGLSFCLLYPDGKHLLTVYTETIKVWDIHTGEQTLQTQPGIGPICSVVFSKQKDFLAVVSEKKVKIINSINFRFFGEIDIKGEITSVEWNSSGEVLAIGTKKGIIEFFNVVTTEKNDFHPLDEPILHIAWRNDSEELAIWYENETFGTLYRKILIWDVRNKKKKKILRSKYQRKSSSSQYHQIQYIRSGRGLLTIENDSIMVWDIEKGTRENGTVDLKSGSHFVYQGYFISVLDTKEIFVWEQETGKGILFMSRVSSHSLKAVDFMEGLLATVTLEGKVSIWDYRHIGKGIQTSFSVKWDYEHPLWVFSHYVQWIRNILPSVFRLNTKSRIKVGDLFDSIITSSVSPNKKYVATGHLGGYLQIYNQLNESIIQYKPFKKGTILFANWSYDEKLISFGTKKIAWIMDMPSGYIKKTLESDSEISTVLWSPIQYLVCVIHLNGVIQIVDFHSNLTGKCVIDTEMSEGHIVGKWSPNGKCVSICYGNHFYVYKIEKLQEKLQLQLLVKGNVNHNVLNIEWSPNGQQIVFLSDKLEIIVVDIYKQEIIRKFDYFFNGLTESLANSLEYMLLPLHEKVLELENNIEIIKKQESVQKIERFAKLLGSSAILAWHSNGNSIAVAVGNWIKVFYMTPVSESDSFYTDEIIICMYWSGDKIYTIESDNLYLREYEVFYPKSERFSNTSL